MANFGNIRNARGLQEEDVARLSQCIAVLEAHERNNAKRLKYYNEKVTAREVNIGIAVPDNMTVGSKITCSWAKKAISTLANRSIFDGFTHSDGNGEDIEELEVLVSQNDLINRYRKSLRSELIHGVNFVTVSRGDELNNEPKAIINIHSANEASAVWDARRNRIAHGLAVVKSDFKTHKPTLVNLYTDTHTIVLSASENGADWFAQYLPHSAGRPLIESLSYNPDELHPFGQSRIAEPVMNIIDSYLRTRLRMEIGAELFTSPQKVISGASDEAFEMDKFETYINKLLVIGKDEDGDVPNVNVLAAQSMQPHIEVLRSLASEFAGATNTPVSELGIIHDNPSSAQAIYAACEPLIIDAQNLNADNGSALVNIAILMLAISRNVPANELNHLKMTLQARFKNPAMPSLVSTADSVVKICANNPAFANTELYWEMVGFDKADISRVQSEILRNQTRALMEGLLADDISETQSTDA